MQLQEYKNRQVVDVSDGEIIGGVADFDLDVEKGTIVGIILKRGRESFVVPFDHVVTFGKDVILVRIGGDESGQNT